MSVITNSLLRDSKYYDTWLAVSENRINDALQTIPGSRSGKERRFLGFFKKKVPVTAQDPILHVVQEFLSGKDSPILVAPTSSLKKSDEHFPEWIRFCGVVQANGHYPQQTKTLLLATLKWLENLVEEVGKKAGDYPRTPIAGYVWKNGAIIRQWCNPLVELFAEKGDLTGKANTLQLKCQLTVSIMGHYPQTLGPDMIAAAAAWEAVGEMTIPQRYYKAIITDFQPMADDIRSMAKEGVTEDDIGTLQALRDAYEGLNRHNQSNDFADKRAWIETLINRGVTAQEEEEDE